MSGSIRSIHCYCAKPLQWFASLGKIRLVGVNLFYTDMQAQTTAAEQQHFCHSYSTSGSKGYDDMNSIMKCFVTAFKKKKGSQWHKKS